MQNNIIVHGSVELIELLNKHQVRIERVDALTFSRFQVMQGRMRIPSFLDSYRIESSISSVKLISYHEDYAADMNKPDEIFAYLVLEEKPGVCSLCNVNESIKAVTVVPESE